MNSQSRRSLYWNFLFTVPLLKLGHLEKGWFWSKRCFTQLSLTLRDLLAMADSDGILALNLTVVNSLHCRQSNPLDYTGDFVLCLAAMQASGKSKHLRWEIMNSEYMNSLQIEKLWLIFHCYSNIKRIKANSIPRLFAFRMVLYQNLISCAITTQK